MRKLLRVVFKNLIVVIACSAILTMLVGIGVALAQMAEYYHWGIWGSIAICFVFLVGLLTAMDWDNNE